jgi:hypothetical protein
MKRFFLLVTLLAVAIGLAACGSPPMTAGASNAGGSDSLMMFSSSHSPRAIARCLSSRLSHVDERTGAGFTELGIGRSSNGYAWLMTLTPTAVGSNVRVEKALDDDSVSEPELRFAIARCTA